MKRIPGARRMIASGLAASLTFVIIRYMLNLEISKDMMVLVIVSATLGSFISRFLHRKGDEMLRKIGI